MSEKNITIAVCDFIMSKYCIIMWEYVSLISKYYSVQIYPYNTKIILLCAMYTEQQYQSGVVQHNVVIIYTVLS